MKTHEGRRVFSVGAVLFALLVPTLAEEQQPAGTPASGAPDAAITPAAKPEGVAPTPAALPKAPDQDGKPVVLSPAVQDILKMADAGVSGEVLRAYAENTPRPAPLGPAEILALKKYSVPDDVTTILLKRSARPQPPGATVQPGTPPVAAAPSAAPAPGVSYLDPESYDYFQYYYLYPRTLAYARGTLGIYPPAYGYYSPFSFGLSFYGPGYGYGGFGHRGYGVNRGFSPGFHRNSFYSPGRGGHPSFGGGR